VAQTRAEFVGVVVGSSTY